MTKEVIMVIVTGVVVPLLTALVGYIISYINVKYKDSKFVMFFNRAKEVIHSGVKQTYQTFVQALKEAGLFDEEAQKKALEDTVAYVHAMLPIKVKQFLENYYGNFDKWLVAEIEAYINTLKEDNADY